MQGQLPKCCVLVMSEMENIKKEIFRNKMPYRTELSNLPLNVMNTLGISYPTEDRTD
jgi:hypothetical protein